MGSHRGAQRRQLVVQTAACSPVHRRERLRQAAARPDRGPAPAPAPPAAAGHPRAPPAGGAPAVRCIRPSSARARGSRSALGRCRELQQTRIDLTRTQALQGGPDRMRVGLRLCGGRTGRLLPLRGRRARIVGRLRRKPQRRLKLSDPRRQLRVLLHQRLDPRHQRGDQSILVRRVRWKRHAQVDSYPGAPRNPEINASPRALSPSRNHLSNHIILAEEKKPLSRLSRFIGFIGQVGPALTRCGRSSFPFGAENAAKPYTKR